MTAIASSDGRPRIVSNWRRFVPDVWVLITLFTGNLVLIVPFFLTEYSNQPWNNSYIYMAISRMFRAHKWSWNSLHYAGAPFHYLYPPLFHLLAAALSFLSVGRAFHIVAGIGYALVPVCLYVLALQLFNSRLLGAFAGTAYSLFPSAIYYLLPNWKNLALAYGNGPWGFVTMVGYEEAAHTLGLAITLLAIAASWRNKWVLSSLLAALVFLLNWPALIGLILSFIAVAIAKARDLGIVSAGLRVAGVVGTAYGLAAFWMTPGYFVSSTLLNRIFLRNTNSPAPWSATATLVLLGAAALIGLSFWRRVPPSFVLLLAWIAVLGGVVASFSLAGIWLVPMPNRYMLELSAVAVLFIVGISSLAPRWTRVIVAAGMVLGATASLGFISHAWSVQPRGVDPRGLLSFQISDWLKGHAGKSRVLVSGELDSTLALWSDVPQVGGTDQDISNFLVLAAQRQVILGCGANANEVADLWLRALNVGFLVVHGVQSREAFHWFSEARKFSSLPVVWDNGAGDKIYRVPGEQEAVVVDLAALRRLPKIRSTDDAEFLKAYVSFATGTRSAQVRWEADDRLTIDAKVAPGEGVLLKSNFDSGWHTSRGSTSRDPIGFMLISGISGQEHLALHFGAPWDVYLGRVITLVTILLLIARIPGWWIAAATLVPAIAAYAVLLTGAPFTARVAEDAFVRLEPPLINPAGVVDSITYQGPPFGQGRILSIYGANFGSGKDSTVVWLMNQKADILYRAPSTIVFKLPTRVPAKTVISVEVNGCRGNGFEFSIR